MVLPNTFQINDIRSEIGDPVSWQRCWTSSSDCFKNFPNCTWCIILLCRSLYSPYGSTTVSLRCLVKKLTLAIIACYYWIAASSELLAEQKLPAACPGSASRHQQDPGMPAVTGIPFALTSGIRHTLPSREREERARLAGLLWQRRERWGREGHWGRSIRDGSQTSEGVRQRGELGTAKEEEDDSIVWPALPLSPSLSLFSGPVSPRFKNIPQLVYECVLQ